MNKQIIKNALILTAFTLVLGLLLGFVYEVTKDPIAKVNEENKKKAFQEVFPKADSFEVLTFDEEEAEKLMADNGYKDTIKDVECTLNKSGSIIGYVITVVAKDGSQGPITFSVGITTEGVVTGYSITDIAETPGLGMKAEEKEFSSQFANKSVDAFVVTKQKATSDNQIEAISGSTITSKAIANGCNAAILFYDTNYGGVADE